MQTKITAIKDKAVTKFQHLSDIRTIGQLVFVVIVLLVSWSGIKSIETNYGLQKQISALQQQNKLQELENDNTRLQNDYYNSNQYLELSARQNFGLAAPGEKEVVVPQSVALKYTVDVPKYGVDAAAATAPKKSNPTIWFDFFLHRNQQQP